MYKAILLACCLALSLAQAEDEIRVGGYAKEFNWYNVGAVNPVEDIGSCSGASTCQAAVSTYETEYYRETATLPTLSTQYCLECSGHDSCDNSSITHENMQKIMEWLRDNGCADASAWPYTAGSTSSGTTSTSGICNATRTKCPNKVHLHKKHKSGKNNMKHWIAKNTVACLIHADDAFRSYTGTINSDAPYECSKNSPSDSELNHGLVAIGYDRHKNWLVQNNWGTGWGDQGYALLKEGKECGLRRRIYRFNSALNLAVTVALVLISVIAF
jgi:C1A family cysteine protease